MAVGNFHCSMRDTEAFYCLFYIGFLSLQQHPTEEAAPQSPTVVVAAVVVVVPSVAVATAVAAAAALLPAKCVLETSESPEKCTHLLDGLPSLKRKQFQHSHKSFFLQKYASAWLLSS